MGMIPSCPLSSDGKDALYNGLPVTLSVNG